MKHTLPLLAALLAPVTSLFAEDASFRPEPGKFPSLEKAHSYRGELTFVDHTNRLSSLDRNTYTNWDGGLRLESFYSF